VKTLLTMRVYHKHKLHSTGAREPTLLLVQCGV
jgi:hypothetical protein